MKVLVIGSGGREHALVWALNKTSRRSLDISCAPGNAGIAESARCVPLAATDVSGLVEFAQRERIDLTVVGPEVSLNVGVVDEFQRRDLRIVGPTVNAARLETSKVFAKDFMRQHSIPTARYRTAVSTRAAIDILRSGEFGDELAPVAIKADGLAAGKGVVVAQSRAEAEQAIYDLCALGNAAESIILVEALTGREASVLLSSDGNEFR